jgi:3-oxoacyl-[acyl-carrier protein] reductase
MRLLGKTAFVTGASRGIGRAIALRFASEGADVLINYNTNRSAAEETVAAIQGIERKSAAYGADTADLAQIRDMLDKIHTTWGKIDILVNNAGVLVPGSLADTKVEDFDRMYAVNVRGVYFLTQAALPVLRDAGRIINLSSIVSTMARYPDMIAYAGTKAAIDAFTRQWALELGPRQITVNAIGPGIIETDMAVGFHGNPKIRENLIRSTPLGRVGQVEDIADIAVFLASDESRWMTGQHLSASGGYHISG